MEINPNSQQPTGSSLPTSALGNIQRPGEYLRQIRVSQKKELEQVSSDLNMPLKTLNALEQDDYKSLPEATFIKGYYRSYAKYLNTDATAIIQRFDEIYANDTGLLPNHALNNSPIKIMGKADVPKANQSNVEVLPMKGSASATAGDQLVLNFNRPTSVHIVDATGKVLATGRQASTLTLNGESPFQIRLDDATAVSLSLNQEQISLSPYTVNGKAEFRLSR